MEDALNFDFVRGDFGRLTNRLTPHPGPPY